VCACARDREDSSADDHRADERRLVVVDDGLIENAIAAPELITRVRASLRAMKITRMRRSPFDAH
jgi:hypothetical protein